MAAYIRPLLVCVRCTVRWYTEFGERTEGSNLSPLCSEVNFSSAPSDTILGRILNCAIPVVQYKLASTYEVNNTTVV